MLWWKSYLQKEWICNAKHSIPHRVRKVRLLWEWCTVNTFSAPSKFSSLLNPSCSSFAYHSEKAMILLITVFSHVREQNNISLFALASHMTQELTWPRYLSSNGNTMVLLAKIEICFFSPYMDGIGSLICTTQSRN